MEIELARNLMQHFFHAPAINGILVFEDNDYLGVVLKRDIEIGIADKSFQLFENINVFKPNQLSEILFKNEPNKAAKIPVVDKTGKLIRIISFEEFQCHFFFEEYSEHFKMESVLDSLEHPLVITSHFKKTIYANKKALELVEKDISGKNFSGVLKLFEIRMDNSSLIAERKGEKFLLNISQSVSKSFSYFIYQFFKL